MKNYFTAIILILFPCSVFAQEIEKQKAYYSELIKQNKTAGRILLYGGAGLVVAPFVVNAITGGDDSVQGGLAIISFPIGIASMVISTTYFNRVARYKKKIASISFINQPLDFSGGDKMMAGSSKHNGGIRIKNSRLLLKTIPAVSLRINF